MTQLLFTNKRKPLMTFFTKKGTKKMRNAYRRKKESLYEHLHLCTSKTG